MHCFRFRFYSCFYQWVTLLGLTLRRKYFERGWKKNLSKIKNSHKCTRPKTNLFRSAFSNLCPWLWCSFLGTHEASVLSSTGAEVNIPRELLPGQPQVLGSVSGLLAFRVHLHVLNAQLKISKVLEGSMPPPFVLIYLNCSFAKSDTLFFPPFFPGLPSTSISPERTPLLWAPGKTMIARILAQWEDVCTHSSSYLGVRLSQRRSCVHQKLANSPVPLAGSLMQCSLTPKSKRKWENTHQGAGSRGLEHLTLLLMFQSCSYCGWS